jgi:hypothetical protein
VGAKEGMNLDETDVPMDSFLFLKLRPSASSTVRYEPVHAVTTLSSIRESLEKKEKRENRDIHTHYILISVCR